MDPRAPVHEQVLDAARRIADRRSEFRMRDVVAALPHLNPATVRTHISSRCCVNAPANHQTRWPYFRALGRGRYRLQSDAALRDKRRASAPQPRASQDRLAELLQRELDSTLIASNLRVTPTERLERLRRMGAFIESARAANA